MQIHTLKLSLTDEDLRAFVERALSDADRIEDLQASFQPEGVRIQGQYPTPLGFKVQFETLWVVKPAGSCLQVHLESINVARMPAGILRSMLLRMIGDEIAGQPGMKLQDDTVLIDVPEAACAHGVNLQVQFTEVRFEAGKATVEAG